MSEVEDLEEFFASIAANPRFTQRSVSIPGDFRTGWRLSILCLLLTRGRANQLALNHLHVLWWAIRTSSSRTLLLKWLRGDKNPDELIVRFDPSLTVTIDLAIGQQLVEKTASGLIKLTSKGGGLADAANSDIEVLVTEKAFLDELPKTITQRQISELLEWT